MKNPAVKTLIFFLHQVNRNAPVNFSTLSREWHRGYSMATQYLRFCIDHDLVRIASERKSRGRYPSREYALSERGSELLSIFDGGRI